MLIVGEEKVPEAIGAGPIANLVKLDRIWDPGFHLVVNRLVEFGFTGVDVFVQEGTDTAEEPFNFGTGFKIHGQEGTTR